nr:MAG TPA: hypothetical protein [Caudoviricetes sp.]
MIGPFCMYAVTVCNDIHMTGNKETLLLKWT